MTLPYQLPKRPADAHKGTFGRVAVIAGSTGMSGAACLAATAALRSGAGLVTAAVPESIQQIVATYEPSYMTLALPCGEDGRLSASAADDILELVAKQDGVAIGPGLGQEPAVRSLIRSVIGHTEVPLVLDADALNVVARDRLSLARSAPTIITPHPGEFSRLSGRSTSDIRSSRESLSTKYAAENGIVVVLKGAGTVVTDGSQTSVNATGNPGMATGGAGDVLTGVIVALCGQGCSAWEAAVMGVHAHGLAGDLCAAERSARGMIASDLLEYLPAAWARLEAE